MLAWAALAHLSAPAAAQPAGNGFLFQPPSATLTLHGGFAAANAGSDLFSDVTEMLTLERRDFGGWSGGAAVAVRLLPRLDVALSASYSGRTRGSEFRDWVEETDGGEAGIEQTTSFERLPVTAGAKLYLAPRGRSIGRFGWVPARLAPYVGAGGGAVWYRFRQTGDFVDFETLDIFWDDLESQGWAPAAEAFAGLDYSLTPRFILVGEARYLQSSAKLDRRSFEGFEPIDLSGPSATLGISYRF